MACGNTDTGADLTEGGCVVFTGDDGAVVDHGALARTGTVDLPATLQLQQPGELSVCAGTWYVQLRIAADVSVVGAGIDDTVLSGGGTLTPIVVEGPDVVVAIDDLQVFRGAASETLMTSLYDLVPVGGGVACSDADLTLTRVRILKSAGEFGGGVGAVACSVTLQDSEIASCRSDYGAGLFLDEGTLSLAGATIRDNSAVHKGGGLFGVAGAITLNDSTVQGNTSDSEAAGVGAYDGTSLEVSNTLIADNVASLRGGGIFASKSVVDLRGTQILRNTSEYGGGMHASDTEVVWIDVELADNFGNYGGGLDLQEGSVATLQRLSAEGNEASPDGGAIRCRLCGVVLEDSNLTGNEAVWGGGLYVWQGEATVRNTVFLENDAQNEGGGLFVQLGSTATVEQSSFYSNSADFGAGLNVENDATVTVLDGVFSANVAVHEGGGLRADNAQVGLEGTSFVSNRADFGGGVALTGAAVLSATGITLEENLALWDGGGLSIADEGSAELTGGVANLNEAVRAGGAVFSDGTGSFASISVDFSSNTPSDGFVTGSGPFDWGLAASVTCDTNCVPTP